MLSVILTLLLLSAALADAFTQRLLTMPCEEALEHYRVAFNHSYPTDESRAEALKQFCKVHASLKVADFSQASFRFHNGTDKPLPYRPPLDMKLIHERLFAQPRYGTPPVNNSCYWYNNGMSSPLPNMTEPLPLSYDLREQGLVGYIGNQQNCGCCWAFMTNAMLSAAIARQAEDLRNVANFSQYFSNGIVTSYLSAEYITIGTGFYCTAGNLDVPLLALETGQMLTVELESNFPFTFGNGHPSPVNSTPIIPSSAYLTPFQAVWNNENQCYASKVLIGWNTSDPAAVEAGTLLQKSYLARGMVVGTYINVKTTNVSESQFNAYYAGVLDIPCVSTSTDHAVAFVGYGKYQGVDVWVLRNSWSQWWGVDGYGYLKMGSDTLCSEQNGMAIIPLYMSLNVSTVYKPNKYTDFTVAKKFVRGSNGLDLECGEGFYSSTTQCHSCSQFTANCSVCSSSQCQQCQQGYYFVSNTNRTCISCASRNCVECNTGYCCSCVEGFWLMNGVCVNQTM